MKESKRSAESVVRDIRRKARRKFTSEDKIRIILEGLRGEDSIAELCRREKIHQNLYYKWSKEFLEAGKRRLNGDTKREADSGEEATLILFVGDIEPWYPPASVALPAYVVLFCLYIGLMLYVCVTPRRDP